MNERIAKKLKKLLAKAGLEEDKVDEVVEEVEAALAEEEVPEEEGNPEEAPLPPSEEEVVEEVPEEVVEEAAPNEEVPPLEEEAAPGDGNIEAALQELAAQEEGAVPPEGEVPPTPDQALPEVPQVDPSAIQQLQSDFAEAQKTIEGLLARIDSLEEALKASGVIANDSKVGDENPRLTPNANQDNADAFDDVLAAINGK